VSPAAARERAESLGWWCSVEARRLRRTFDFESAEALLVFVSTVLAIGRASGLRPAVATAGDRVRIGLAARDGRGLAAEELDFAATANRLAAGAESAGRTVLPPIFSPTTDYTTLPGHLERLAVVLGQLRDARADLRLLRADLGEPEAPDDPGESGWSAELYLASMVDQVLADSLDPLLGDVERMIHRAEAIDEGRERYPAVSPDAVSLDPAVSPDAGLLGPAPGSPADATGREAETEG
jgi:pterin-4a-carbinolamine dehydratase